MVCEVNDQGKTSLEVNTEWSEYIKIACPLDETMNGFILFDNEEYMAPLLLEG